VDFADDQAEDMEDRSFRRVLAQQDREQGFALLGTGPLVDDRLDLAVALMKRTRKIDGDGELDSVELGLVEMSPLDVHRHQAFAIPVARAGVEIARATERAVAVLDPLAFQTPVGHRHNNLLLVSSPKSIPGRRRLSSSGLAPVNG